MIIRSQSFDVLHLSAISNDFSIFITFVPFEDALSLLLTIPPTLFGRVLEYRKSDTWSKASLDGVDTQPVKVSPAPIESGLDPGPRPFPLPVTIIDDD